MAYLTSGLSPAKVPCSVYQKGGFSTVLFKCNTCSNTCTNYSLVPNAVGVVTTVYPCTLDMLLDIITHTHTHTLLNSHTHSLSLKLFPWPTCCAELDDEYLYLKRTPHSVSHTPTHTHTHTHMSVHTYTLGYRLSSLKHTHPLIAQRKIIFFSKLFPAMIKIRETMHTQCSSI